jgi:hypothetical protein
MSEKVTNAAIRDLLDAVGGQPLLVVEIIDALGYTYDDISAVCARLRGMEKRKKFGVQSVEVGGKKKWFRTSWNV